MPPAPESTAGKKRIVIVGLGMVGMAFVEKMLERDLLAKEYVMTVLGEERYLAYNRVGLTEYFAHRSVDGLFLNDEAWYANVDPNHMTYRVNDKAKSIDRVAKTVTTASGDVLPYDVLIMATGSTAVLPTALLPALPPSCESYRDMGVYVYRTIDDVQSMIQFSENFKKTHADSQTPSRAIVVGGGLLGLEAAKALYDLETFSELGLVHRSGWLLSQQLDAAGGKMLADSVEKMGVKVMLNTEIKELVFTDNKLSAVIYKDGRQEDCQLLCYAIGISPRDELAATADLKTGARGGFVVDDNLRTNDPHIYAVGECACWNGKTFGLIAPGVEMADVLSHNLSVQARLHAPRLFEEPDIGTRLKLMGVDVASFGDYFCDRFGPKTWPGHKAKGFVPTKDDVVALAYEDHFAGVYKKLIFTKSGDYLLGGILVGDISEFTKFNSMVSSKKKLDKSPTEYMVGSKGSAEDDVADLDDSAQVCSCHNVTKGAIKAKILDGTCKSVGEVKSCTKAGTACGGCEGTVKAIFNAEMKALGMEVSNALCIHFKESRADLFHIIMVKKLDTFDKVMKEVSRLPESAGCEICKPTIASILASLYNRHVMDERYRGLQETNDRFLGNIQRNGTYSVVPRVSAGEITPEKLIAMGAVASKYNLYTKITGGQRIDLFGAKKQDLPEIWEELGKAGLESGHAYGKSLRTVKSCVGTTWCRYGIGDSVGMAVRLEERYKSLRSPHKIKGGVSGCVRDCAEFHNKDFGLCSVKNGFNVYVGGNGGMKPAHAQLLAQDVLPDRVIPLLDRYLMFYIRTADKLQRTARWLENLPGGIDYLREVIIDDKLGICKDLEEQMNNIVGSFFDEWAEAVKDKEMRHDFKQFANTNKTIDSVEIVYERGQARPADWPEEDKVKREVFKDAKWSSTSWQEVCSATELPDTPAGSSTTILIGDTQIALFKSEGRLFASQNMCGHRRAFVLSQGIIGMDENNETYVSCPLHKRNYILERNKDNTGSCKNDDSQSIATFDIKEENGKIFVKLPPTEELDRLLGTNRWKVKKSESSPHYTELDDKYKMALPQRVTCGDAAGDTLSW